MVTRVSFEEKKKRKALEVEAKASASIAVARSSNFDEVYHKSLLLVSWRNAQIASISTELIWKSCSTNRAHSVG